MDDFTLQTVIHTTLGPQGSGITWLALWERAEEVAQSTSQSDSIGNNLRVSLQNFETATADLTEQLRQYGISAPSQSRQSSILSQSRSSWVDNPSVNAMRDSFKRAAHRYILEGKASELVGFASQVDFNLRSLAETTYPANSAAQDSLNVLMTLCPKIEDSLSKLNKYIKNRDYSHGARSIKKKR